jgi:aerobic carbon-monoxide dehydrogenase large subunit
MIDDESLKSYITPKYVGTSILRKEDQRFLTGYGQYVPDLNLPGMLQAAFVRSSIPHGRIVRVDFSEALKVPGVVFAMSGADLGKDLPSTPNQQVNLPSRFKKSVKHRILDLRQPLMAVDKVVHVGEAIAVVLADSRYAAEDAAEQVIVEIEALAPVVDPERALQEESAIIHERFGTNLIAEYLFEKGDVEAALANAPHKLQQRFYTHRYACMPLDGRGIVSAYDARTEILTVWCSTQIAHWVRRDVANTLGIAESKVRCVAPDVGGGFGGKGHVYPDDLLIPYLARKLKRPVKWIEDRREHFLSACHSRDQHHDVEVGFDGEGRILAFRDRYIVDSGAFMPAGLAPITNTATHLQGPYKIPNFVAEAKVVATNKVASAPYRGAGRPEAAFAMERTMELIAGALGLEPAEVRFRNMIPPSEMPYPVGIPFRDGVPIVYDSGDYPQALRKALDAIGGLNEFRQRQQAARKNGRYLGLGIGCYTEGTGAGPFESATVRIDMTGKVYVAAGACNHGQGMETAYAQIAADAWGVEPSDVMVTLGDTAAIEHGYGTIASRSTVTASGAIVHASKRLREKVFRIAAHVLECSVDDLVLRDGNVEVAGVPGLKLSLAEVAGAARPGWDSNRPEGIDADLRETYFFEPPTTTWAYAVHCTIVDVDIDFGTVKFEKYVIVHDCGRIVNPMLVEGQIIGGTVQGIGGALFEELIYDEEGQLLNASFMEYLLPTATELPTFEIIHQQSPSPTNPLGVKGLGEGGAIAAPVAVANAVSDALSPFGVSINSTPIRPEQLVNECRRSTSSRM